MARPLLPGVAPDATALLAVPGPAGQGRKRGRAPRRPAGGAPQRGSGRDSNRPPQPRAFRHRVHDAGGSGGGSDDDGGGPGNRAAHGSNYPGRTPDLRSTAFFSAPPPAIPPRTGDSYNASSGGGGGNESSKESMVRNGSRTVGAGPRAPTGESSLPTPHRRLRWTAPVSPMSAAGGGGEGGGGGGAGRTQDSATITPGFPPARETGSRRSSALGDDERRELVDWLKGELKRCGRERERESGGSAICEPTTSPSLLRATNSVV
jgi:hypothetical protein